MKIVLNPTYSHLSTFVSSLSDRFEAEGDVIYDERNMLKSYCINGLNVVVKRFRKPHIINQIAYSYFRASKAKRSYQHALFLLEKGISTPAPIAYIEEKKGGLLQYSYYVCIYEKEYSHIRKQMLGELGDVEFQQELARFIACLHSKGILDYDLSPGNVLFKVNEGTTHFSLIDINRMSFMKVIPLKKRYQNFKRISENTAIITCIAKEYALVCGLNEQEAIFEINKYCQQFIR